MDEQLYTNGFNDGYNMSEVDPEMAEIISDTLSGQDNAYDAGWVDGREQYDLGLKVEKASELEQLRDNKDPERER